MDRPKYYLRCVKCGHKTPDFATWFANKQMCTECGSKHSEVFYNADYGKLKTLFRESPQSFWHYFDFLPLTDRKNIITENEGAIPIVRWRSFEQLAKAKFGLNLTVYVYRNDLNGGTGTFKDVAAALAAALLKEHGIKQYCVASTGNTATSFAKYLAIAGVGCSVFLPQDAIKASEAMISAYGQQVYRVRGDYSKAKSLAADFASKYDILISSGNIDPIRVEAKKTMVFEWLRQTGNVPDIYIQAVSGGTGPIAVDKGVREVRQLLPQTELPKLIMVQPDGCDPMTTAWEKAKQQHFPPNFENDYSAIDNPQTAVPTLATGNPATYPVVAGLVKKSNGDFLRVSESTLRDYAALVACEEKVMIGPASAVCVAGFFKAMEQGLINNGNTVMVNIGEGVLRAPDFVEELLHAPKNITSVDECKPAAPDALRDELYKRLFA